MREHARAGSPVREHVRQPPAAPVAAAGVFSLAASLDLITAGVQNFQAVVAALFAAAPPDAQELLAPLVVQTAKHGAAFAEGIGQIEAIARSVRAARSTV